jgi:hypothetical protein
VEGRPDGFHGAVGDFKFDRADIPARWTTGEPQQIGAWLSGSGNFALMNAPDLNPQEHWKTYPGKSEFTAGDKASFSGSKRFQFSAVPRKGGNQELALKLSFFDPTSASYKEISSPLRKIEVAGQDMAEEEPIRSTEAAVEKKDTIVGQHLVMSSTGQLVPLVFRPSFVSLLASGAALCLLGGILAWWRIRRFDPKRCTRAATEKAIREAIETAARQAESRNVSGFFSSARRALQEQLGALWQQPAQAITLAEVSARISDNSSVARFFREADLHEYGHHSNSSGLSEWRALLDEAMTSLSSPDH